MVFRRRENCCSSDCPPKQHERSWGRQGQLEGLPRNMLAKSTELIGYTTSSILNLRRRLGEQIEGKSLKPPKTMVAIWRARGFAKQIDQSMRWSSAEITHRKTSFESSPKLAGMAPERLFKYRSRLTSCERFPRLAGISPEMLLLYSSLHICGVIYADEISQFSPMASAFTNLSELLQISHHFQISETHRITSAS